MRQSVIDKWRLWNEKNEYWANFPYVDSIGLLTTGMGNMIDPKLGRNPYSLPWKIDGVLADAATVRAQLQTVIDAYPGVQSVACKGLTTIRLDDSDIQALINETITENESVLRHYFSDWDSLPADEQAAIMSKAWAMGPGFAKGFPTFDALVESGQYQRGEVAGHYRGGGTAGRQAQEDIAQGNAQVVKDRGLDPSTLYWPEDLTKARVASSGGGLVLGVLALLGIAWAVLKGRA